MLGIMLVEDDSRFRERLRRVVDGSGTLRLVHSAGNVKDALRFLQQDTPDVLLVDLGLPDGSGIAVIRAAAARCPSCEILVVSVYGDHANVLACIEAGATGYLLKEDFEDDMLLHIDRLHNGGSPVSPVIARELLRRLQRRDQRPAPEHQAEPMTPRETQVLDLLSRGFNYREIGELLHVSKNTIETYIKRLYRKLQVNSRSEAVFEAQRLHLLS